MDWATLVAKMTAAGFSPGEAVILAALAVIVVRLKVRQDALAADRFRMWEGFVAKCIELERGIRDSLKSHERRFHDRTDP